MDKDMVKVVFFVGLRRSRARVGTGGVESDDRGITRELVSPSLGETESWIGVVQFVQSQIRDVGLSDSYTYSLLYARTGIDTGGPTPAGERRGAQRGGPERPGALSGEDQRESHDRAGLFTGSQGAWRPGMVGATVGCNGKREI